MRAKLPSEQEVWIGHSDSLHFLEPGFLKLSPPTALRLRTDQELEDSLEVLVGGRLVDGSQMSLTAEGKTQRCTWAQRSSRSPSNSGLYFLIFSRWKDCLRAERIRMGRELTGPQSEEASLSQGQGWGRAEQGELGGFSPVCKYFPISLEIACRVAIRGQQSFLERLPGSWLEIPGQKVHLGADFPA